MKAFIRLPKSILFFLFIYMLSIANMRNSLAFGGFSVTLVLYASLAFSFLYFFILSLQAKTKASRLRFSSTVLCVSLLPSVLLSEVVDVSVMKYVVFTLGFITLTLIAERISLQPAHNKQKLALYVRNINRLLLLVCIPIYILGLGYTRNKTGFSGALNHPQAHGVFLVLVVLIELYCVQVKLSKPLWVTLFIFLASVFSFMTESRLSIFSILIVLSVYAYSNFKLTKKQLLALLIALAGMLFYSEKILHKMDYVITKSGRAEQSGLAALKDSRGELATASIMNFLDHPIAGIGFQISNGKYGHYPMEVKRSQPFNLPTKASIEKGVFWSALLEETGLLGTMGMLFFFYQFSKAMKGKMSRLVILSMFLIGCGESFYFSFGGLGVIVWAVLFLFYAVGNTTKPLPEVEKRC